MRRVVIGAVGLAALAGCGGTAEHPAAARKAPAKHAAVAREQRAPVALYMYRVLGDDPTPDAITLRRDGSVLVMRGGGHGDSTYHDVVLSARQQRRVLWLARRAPLRILAHNTIEPGGFGGNDNAMRYLIRRDGTSVGVQQGDIPRPIRPLVRELDRIIEDYEGHIVRSWMQSGAVLD